MGFLSKSCSFDASLAYDWLSFLAGLDRYRFLNQFKDVNSMRTKRIAPGALWSGREASLGWVHAYRGQSQQSLFLRAHPSYPHFRCSHYYYYHHHHHHHPLVSPRRRSPARPPPRNPKAHGGLCSYRPRGKARGREPGRLRDHWGLMTLAFKDPPVV